MGKYDSLRLPFTMRQCEVRIQPALDTGYFFYEIAGSGEEKSLVFTEFNKPVTQDGLTVEYGPAGKMPGDSQVHGAFKLTWEGEEIVVAADGFYSQLEQGIANWAILEVSGNFGGQVFTKPVTGGIYNNYYGYRLGAGLWFENIGEQLNLRDAACQRLGECDEPNILIKWIADYRFLIDY